MTTRPDAPKELSRDLPRAPLTPVERKVWHSLIDHVATHTYQPSVREIARHFRIPSTRTVTQLLEALASKGYVRRVSGRSRGVVLEGFTGGVGTQPVPLVQYGGDGQPIVERHYTLDRQLLASDDAFLVRTNAEDAPRHATREGDLVLVVPTARAGDETPVVVRHGTRILVRLLVRRGTTVLLLAPAPGVPDLELRDGDDFRVLGPVGLVLRISTAPDSDDD
ncbi:MAG TPA: S24 family peptidase [Gemmatimonadaceae bacterium]|nr:S24 family peptidase [Gemmatimonadaceae bacterium]